MLLPLWQHREKRQLATGRCCTDRMRGMVSWAKKKLELATEGWCRCPSSLPACLALPQRRLALPAGRKRKEKTTSFCSVPPPLPKTAPAESQSAQPPGSTLALRSVSTAKVCAALAVRSAGTWPTPAGQPSIMMLAQTQHEIGGFMPALVPLAHRVCSLAAALFSGPSHCAVVGWSAEQRQPASPAASHAARVGQHGASLHQPSTFRPLMGRQL